MHSRASILLLLTPRQVKDEGTKLRQSIIQEQEQARAAVKSHLSLRLDLLDKLRKLEESQKKRQKTSEDRRKANREQETTALRQKVMRDYRLQKKKEELVRKTRPKVSFEGVFDQRKRRRGRARG